VTEARRRFGRAFRHRRVLLTAICELAAARVWLAFASERGVVDWVRRSGAGAAAPGGDAVDLAALSWALSVSARRVPWRADCLVAALAAIRWLRRLRLTPEAFVGVAKTADGAFVAHAWVRCAHQPVVGAGAAEFVAIIGPDAPQASGSDRLR
jgi:hypothetical protein